MGQALLLGKKMERKALCPFEKTQKAKEKEKEEKEEEEKYFKIFSNTPCNMLDHPKLVWQFWIQRKIPSLKTVPFSI